MNPLEILLIVSACFCALVAAAGLVAAINADKREMDGIDEELGNYDNIGDCYVPGVE